MTKQERNNARRKYHDQRFGAAKRGIEWHFDFDTWLEFWLESGKWSMRGPYKGQYVMSRFNDVGPYRIDNVFIQTSEQNSKDGNIGRHPTDETRAKYKLRRRPTPPTAEESLRRSESQKKSWEIRRLTGRDNKTVNRWTKNA